MSTAGVATAGELPPAPPETAAAGPAGLPPLRQDLQLHAAAPQADGSPGWVIQDPVTQDFYRIGWLEFELLSRWAAAADAGGPARLLQQVAQETPLRPGREELAALLQFLATHQLLARHDDEHTLRLAAHRRRLQPGRARWLLHNYLFFRVPLLRPAHALQALLPALQGLYTRGALLALALLAALGLLLTARSWDSFAHSVVETLTPQGLWGYALALLLTKTLHELGHALTATRYGLRVPQMGVAFVVMWPMLYTDTRETWRLASRRQRLAVTAAGLAAEGALAVLATLAWHLAPEGGVLKPSLLVLASTAWVVSLALNLSPFMRFDGYFILSDLLDLPNLHERSFALARAALRRGLLGLPEPDPERFSPGRRRALVVFAWATWLYRLAIFIGIAVAVYVFFFKLLGLLLLVVEIMWFVLRPVSDELRHWRRHRQAIVPRRALRAAVLGAGVLLLAALPWQRQVDAVAWAQPLQLHTFYSPLPARVISIAAPGQTLRAGTPVLVLEQPDIQHRSELSRGAAATLQQRLLGLGGDVQGEERRAPLQQQQALRQAEWRAQRDEAARLSLAAPFDGVLMEVDPELAAGVWVSPRQPLALLVDPRQWQAEAYVTQHDLPRVEAGATVRFHPEGAALGRVLSGRVLDVAAGRSANLPQALLAAPHGGPLAVQADAATASLVPRDTLYRVRIRLDDVPATAQVLRGSVAIEADAQSPLRAWLQAAAVLLLREASF